MLVYMSKMTVYIVVKVDDKERPDSGPLSQYTSAQVDKLELQDVMTMHGYAADYVKEVETYLDEQECAIIGVWSEKMHAQAYADSIGNDRCYVVEQEVR